MLAKNYLIEMHADWPVTVQPKIRAAREADWTCGAVWCSNTINMYVTGFQVNRICVATLHRPNNALKTALKLIGCVRCFLAICIRVPEPSIPAFLNQ